MDAFISHSSRDNAIAGRLEQELEAGGLEVWTDLSEIRAGALLGPQLLNNIRDSEILLLLWSEPAAGSRWVAVEWLIALHENKLIVPCVVDPTPLPQCLQRAVHLDLGRDLAQVVRQISRLVKETPLQPARVVVPAKGGLSPELRELINDILRGQSQVLGHLDRREVEAARKEQEILDGLVSRAIQGWPYDTFVVTTEGYHLKNAYQIEHHAEIQAGRRPRDLLLDRAERRFFDALSINPMDHAALNGIGNYLWFLCEYDAAEFFTLAAIKFAKKEGADTSYYAHDLALIRRDQAANAP